MVGLCRKGPVRLPYNNSTQFPESLAQHVRSGGDSIVSLECIPREYRICNTL